MAKIKFDFAQINAVYRPYMLDSTRHLVMVGGAGSGKSYFCADKCILAMISNPGERIMAFRKVARTLKESSWELLLQRLDHWGVLPYCKTNKSDLTIQFKNGSKILCIGLDDQEKLKSIVGMTRAWIEEATEFTPDDLTQINLRLRGESPSYKQILYSFNPISIMHHIKKRFFDDPPDNCKTVRTTYKDNAYIDDDYRAEIESLAESSANLYQVYALGMWGVLKGLIFKGWEYLSKYPTVWDSECYGLDMGYNHPMALTHVGALDGEYYLTEIVYASELTNGDLMARMESAGVPKNAIIQCDEAKPDTIAELNRNGWYNATACHKGKGSVAAGIGFVQSQTIYTKHTNTNINKEMLSYSWRTDRAGNPQDEPVKLMDDAMDSIRYALWGTYGKPKAQLQQLDRKALGM